jgi:hypothetical protein
MKSLEKKELSSKLTTLKEMEISDLNIIGGKWPSFNLGIVVTANWGGWFDGSLVSSLFDGVRGIDVNEFD